MSRIVVGVDGSRESAAALRWALDEAKARAARLDVVMAWQYPVPLDAILPEAEQMDRETQEVVEHMVEAIDPSAGAGVDIHPRVFRGPAGPALVDAADGAELLVVGSQGRGRFASLVLGSVSLFCVSKSPCSVVVVPPPAASDAA
jgi:nucleotide-binding universal stress UspA family protein